MINYDYINVRDCVQEKLECHYQFICSKTGSDLTFAISAKSRSSTLIACTQQQIVMY